MEIERRTDAAFTNTIDKVLVDMRHKIVAGEYKTGDKIAEAELSEHYGVSRGSVRSALNVLRGEGLVRFLPNARKEIVCLTARQIRNLYELRWMIENSAIKTVMSERLMGFTPIVEALEDMRLSNRLGADISVFYDLDIRFHRGLVLVADNLALSRAWEVNTPVMRELMYQYRVQADHEYGENLYEDHRQMFDLMVTGDERVFGIHRKHIMDVFIKQERYQPGDPDAGLNKL